MKPLDIAMAAALLAVASCASADRDRTRARVAPAPTSCDSRFVIGRSELTAAAVPRRCYTSDDISRTGATNAADALALLDPSITIHR